MTDSDERKSGRFGRIVRGSLVLSVAALLIVMMFQACTDSSDSKEFSRASTLASTCAACHGTSGQSALDDIPSLAGLSAQEILRELRDYGDDEYGSTSMHHLVHGYSEEELEQIAEYFANLESGGGLQ